MKSYELKSLDSANYVIGKSAQYYTLWSIINDVYAYNPETRNTEKCVRYEYIQNVCMNKEDLIGKCPQLNVNECISGNRSFYVFEKREQINDFSKFMFGKYRGEYLNNIGDISYLKWYFFNCSELQTPMVAARLEELGFYVVNNCIMTREEMDEFNKRDEIINALKNKIENNESLDLFPLSNLCHREKDNFASISDIDDVHNVSVEYRFPNYSENYYNGYSYYLPTINGKSKRIKNKKVVISDYDFEYESNGKWDFNLVINVKNFKIEK